jgi:alanyl-tRNA synthetase
LSDSEILLKAVVNRIAARITEKLINSAQEFTETAEELPQKLQNEWISFKEEVIEESERLEKKTNESKEKSSEEQLSKEDSIQIQIDNLRSKVIDINKDIEGRN